MTAFAKARKQPVFVAAAIVFAAVLLNYLAKGVMPFGAQSAASLDLAQGYLPVFYHVREAIFGSKSILFDWNSGGVTMLGTDAMYTLFSPLNLLFAFIPEEKMLGFLSWLLAIKFSLMAASAAVFFTKRFPHLNDFWSVVLAVFYPLSGFAMLYYSNIIWFDAAALFPLLLLAAEDLIVRGKCRNFIVLLSFMWVINFYNAFMTTLFLFFAGGAYLIFFLSKKERGTAALRLGLSVAAAVAFAAFILLPVYLQTQISVRANEGRSLAEILTTFNIYLSVGKAVAFTGLDLCFVAVLMLLFKFKDDRRNTGFLLTILSFVLVPVLCEGTNLVWHAGSYVSFPYRYGFAAAMVLLSCTAYYLQKHHAPSSDILSKKTVYILSGISLAMAVFVPLAFKLTASALQIDAASVSTACTLVAVGLGCAAVYVLLLNSEPKKMIYVLLALFLVARIGMETYNCLIPVVRNEADKLDRYVGETLDIKAEFSQELAQLEPLERVANKDNRLQTNYPFILGAESLSNWTHVISQSVRDSAESLGYSVPFTRLLDAGGTAFSDAVYNKRLFLSAYGLNPKIYTEKKSAAGFTMYEPRLTLPLGLSGSAELAEIENVLSIETFEYQNKLFNALGGEGELFRIAADETLSGEGTLKFDFTAEKDEIFYLIYEMSPEERALPERTTLGLFRVSVDGKTLAVPEYASTGNTLYPVKYNGTVLEMGRFSFGDKIELELSTDFKFIGGRLRVAAMDVEAMQMLSQRFSGVQGVVMGKRSLELSYNNSLNDEILLLPVGLDRGFSCKVNGAETQLLSVGGLVGVPLSDGENRVEIHFFPYGMKTGIIISAVSLIVALLSWAAYSFIKKRKPSFAAPQAFCTAAKLLYLAAFGCSVALFYVFQLFYTVYKLCTMVLGKII